MPDTYQKLTKKVALKDECDAALVLAAVRKCSVPALVRRGESGMYEVVVHAHHEPELLDAALFVLTSRN